MGNRDARHTRPRLPLSATRRKKTYLRTFVVIDDAGLNFPRRKLAGPVAVRIALHRVSNAPNLGCLEVERLNWRRRAPGMPSTDHLREQSDRHRFCSSTPPERCPSEPWPLMGSHALRTFAPNWDGNKCPPQASSPGASFDRHV